MRQSPALLAFGLFFALAGIPLIGCTLIGYSIGTSIDEGNAIRRTVPVGDFKELQTNDICTLTRTDSCVLRGRYSGLHVVPRSEFLPLYDQWKAADSTRRNMPSVGDSVEIVWVSRTQRPLRGRLIHISTDSLTVLERSDAVVSLKGAALRDVQTVSSAHSGIIDGQQIRNNTTGPSFPRTTHFILSIDGQEIATPVDSIAFVDVVQSTSPVGWRIAGTGLGIVLDVAAVYGILYGLAVLSYAAQ